MSKFYQTSAPVSLPSPERQYLQKSWLQVYLAGHDLGGGLGWHICALRPDLVKGYVSFGVPYANSKSFANYKSDPEPEQTNVSHRGLTLPPMEGFYVNRFAVSISSIEREQHSEYELLKTRTAEFVHISHLTVVHMLGFVEHVRTQQPGRADADFGRFDVRTVFTSIYKLFCKSDIPVATESQEILDLVHPAEPLPSFLSKEDVEVFVEHYEKSGFSNPVRASYINIPR